MLQHKLFKQICFLIWSKTLDMPNRILKFTVSLLLTVLDVNFGLYNH